MRDLENELANYRNRQALLIGKNMQVFNKRGFYHPKETQLPKLRAN